MKTQINSLVKGDHRESIVGTKFTIRTAIASKVREENPEVLRIKLRGRELLLTANWSISRKSVQYIGEAPLDLYQEFFGGFGVPASDPKASLNITSDCFVFFTTNSKKDFIKYIPESEIEIL